MKAYEMEMTFMATIGLKAINNILQELGDSGKYQVRDALEISVKQTLPVIPTDEYIRTVEQTIVQHYETADINILECRFAGYKYLREIEIPDKGVDGNA